MDSLSWDIENRRSFEHTKNMSSKPLSSHQDNSLPPLHQVQFPFDELFEFNFEDFLNTHDDEKAIPEFHSHNPHERRSSSVPRKLVERNSPSFKHPHHVSPSSTAYSDTSASKDTNLFLELDLDQYLYQELDPGCLEIWENDYLTEAITVSTSSDPGDLYDAQVYMFPGNASIDTRRMSGLSSASPSFGGMEPRPSPYLPPVSSLTSSRGSSLDIESSERPLATPTMPPYGTHQSSGYGHSYEHELRNPPSQSQDYNRYSSGSAISPTSYRSTSPANQYSQPQYYSHSGSYSQPPRSQAGYSRQTIGADGRSPFSTPSHPVELSMDHFEQGRPGKRRRGNLPKHVTDLLRGWLTEHMSHPYPTEDEKQMLMNQTGLTIHQISNWFINARRRRIPAMNHPESKPSTPRRPGSGH